MPQQSKVRWAILGAGKIAHKFTQDFKATQRGELIGIASTNTERAQGFAQQYGIPQVYTYDALYTSPDVDAVYIATPHNFHYEQSLQCINNGKAVLCEKPVTINDVEAKALLTAATEKKVFFMEAMWMYFLPALQRAKAWINDGRIGTLKLIQADFGFAMPFDPQGRLFNPALAGGGLLDLGVYALAFAHHFAGAKLNAVVASGIMGRTGVDETTAIALTYETLVASLATSITTRLRNKALLFGDTGFIEIPDFWKSRSATLYNGEHEILETFTDDRSTWGYNFEIQEATDCILNGALQSAVVPHATSIHLQELMTEVRRQLHFKYPMET